MQRESDFGGRKYFVENSIASPPESTGMSLKALCLHDFNRRLKMCSYFGSLFAFTYNRKRILRHSYCELKHKNVRDDDNLRNQ